MAQIWTEPGTLPKEEVSLIIDDPDLDFVTASNLAKEKARQINKNAMMLSWKNGLTGEYYPHYEGCGSDDRPVWIVFADARGGNLTITVNDGQYIFIYLKL